MSDLSIGAVSAARPGPEIPGPAAAVKGPGFGEALRGALDQVNQLQQAADQATQGFALGQTQDVAGTMIAIEKANLAFQFTLQIRNKLLEAYQEVMRMPM
jgi:flagellar hook-basal body complex protein FliE